MKLESLRHELAEAARQLAAEQLCPRSSGNLSALDRASGLIAITPSAINKADLIAEDIVVIDAGGEVVEGRWKPTSELHLHTIFYRRRPDVGVVVHTHAPYATVFSIIDMPLPVVLTESAAFLSHETIPLAPYRRPGTAELAEIVLETLAGDGIAAIMEHHGLLTVGQTLDRALHATLAVETNARAVVLARSMGFEPKRLAAEEQAAMRAAIAGYRPVLLNDQ